MDRKLQRHRADSLRQHGFLVLIWSLSRISVGSLDFVEVDVFCLNNYILLILHVYFSAFRILHYVIIRVTGYLYAPHWQHK